MAKNKNNRGRPRLYEEKVQPHLEEIRMWVRARASQAEIAAALGIASSTFTNYCREYKELRDIVAVEKLAGVPEVKLKLYNRCMGYDYEERKTYIKRDNETGRETTYTEIIRKHMPSDVGACNMFLRNYAEGWKDRDSEYYKLKETELELKKRIVDSQTF